jgi:hypothetical protein
MPHQGRSTYESAPPLKGTPHYSYSEGNSTDKSKASPPVARRKRARKHPVTDEKIFTIGEQYNNQYNKIYAQRSLEVCSEGAGGHHSSYVMVWWGVSHRGVTPLNFCEKGVKTGARVYQEDVLQGVVKPFNRTVFSGQK